MDHLTEQVFQTIKTMPEPLVQEILDFALFLRQREAQAEWQNLMSAQTRTLAEIGTTEKTRCGTMFRPSEIVLRPFPFTDLSSHKKRPVLILTAANAQTDF